MAIGMTGTKTTTTTTLDSGGTGGTSNTVLLNDIQNFLSNQAPKINTTEDYATMVGAMTNVVNSNNQIITAIETVIPRLVSDNNVQYYVTELNTNSNIFQVSGSDAYYTGSYHYDYTDKKFYSGTTPEYEQKIELIYVYEDTFNEYDYASIMQKGKEDIVTATRQFITAANNIVVNLNLKYSYSVALQNLLIEYLSTPAVMSNVSLARDNTKLKTQVERYERILDRLRREAVLPEGWENW